MKLTIQQVLECTEWKTCSKCGDEKKVIFFAKMGKGYRPDCKACNALSYRNRKANKYLESKNKTTVEKFTSWLKSLV